MDSNIDLKKIWGQQEASPPKVQDLYNKANRFKRISRFKLFAVNASIFLTSIFIGFIWYSYQPDLLSTKIGMTLIILAMIIFIIPYNRQLSLLSVNQIESNSKVYLQQLIKLNKKQSFLQTTMLSIYFIIISIGIGLYMFEYVLKMSFIWGCVAYGITLLWIVFNWFYLRPKVILKQRTKMDNLIQQFSNLNTQLSE